MNIFFEVLGMSSDSNAVATGVKIKVVRRYCDIRVYINTKNRKIINPNKSTAINAKISGAFIKVVINDSS